MFDTKKTEILLEELLENNHSPINFPKKIGFQFPEIYKNLVTQIKTTDISAECILFSSVESVNQSKEFSHPDYWSSEFEAEKIKDYWFFGANGQGDSWVFHEEDKVFFYDHNAGEISENTLIDLNINFEKWLQFAFLNKEWEDTQMEDDMTSETKEIYLLKLRDLSLELANNYPFEI